MGNIFNHVVVSTDGSGKPRTFKGLRNNKQMNRTHYRWLGSYLAILASKPVPSIWDVKPQQENYGYDSITE